ncbi:unnamed protein product [Thlaspi arvense]|uniref:Uncharacterized protein n=1 Tax=Thlaspi arvense TaxID=13288 RepID=A0AAU9TC95_THLAR|nr:unnamed protein product [Thlaspi arvense]
MSNRDDVLKMHISHGDLFTWSIFEDFIKEREIENKAEQVLYKLKSEYISVARSIYKSKDAEIMEMAEEAKGVNEVDLYIASGERADVDFSVNVDGEADVEDNEVDDEEKSEDKNSDDEAKSDDDNREEESDDGEINDDVNREEQEKPDGDGPQSEGEEHILDVGASDPRFTNLIEHGEHVVVEGQSNPNPPKRRRKTPVSAAQSQSSIPAPVATDQSQPSIPSLSSAPEASSSAPLRGRGRGHPPGRGQARKETIPRGHGVYISPFSNRVFKVWGDRARDVGGSSIRGSRGRK